MKNQFRVLFALLGVFLMGLNSQAEELLSYKDWKAEKIEKHELTGKPACVAYTELPDEKLRLEIYAEKSDAEESYVAPLVQLVAQVDGNNQYVGGLVNLGGEGQLMSKGEDKVLEVESETGSKEIKAKGPKMVSFLSSRVDSENMIFEIKEKNYFEVELLQRPNTRRDEVAEEGADFAQSKVSRFSLKGSFKVVKTLQEKCL